MLRILTAISFAENQVFYFFGFALMKFILFFSRKDYFTWVNKWTKLQADLFIDACFTL